jgi:type I restriction enzyme S subunit
MYGASVGNIAISNIDACVNQACCCIKTNEFNNLKYMFYWLFSCKNDFLKITDGGGQPNISQTKIKNQYYLKPPIEEQHRIVDFLDTKCARIDSIVEDKQKQISTLDEYKKSLIYEYVTGKKEVPSA